MLQLKNLTKKFGSFTAVNNLNLELKKGDFFGFLGPNGAGKTTTIKMIVGLLSPTEGDIFIKNLNSKEYPIEVKKIFGYIPDQPFLYDKLTGREFLYFSGGLFGLNGNNLKEQIDKTIDLLKIASWIDRKTENYSQGMRQRIAIASSILHDPEIIIIDEPMVGLDPQSAKILKDVFLQKVADGCLIVMSTHSLNIAEEICNRIGIIKEGNLIFDNNLDALKSFQKTEYKNLEYFFLELTQA